MAGKRNRRITIKKMKTNLYRGLLATFVLVLVKNNPLHGFELSKEIEKASNRVVKVRESTLYPVLHRLEKAGLLTSKRERSSKGPPKKVYSLTARGEKLVLETYKMYRETILSLDEIIKRNFHVNEETRESSRV